jgi:hypothetical protein
MADLLKVLQGVKQFKIDPDKIYIEDTIFRLFSKATVGILTIAAGLVTLQSLIGMYTTQFNKLVMIQIFKSISEICRG